MDSAVSKQISNLRLKNGSPISAETAYELKMMYHSLSDAEEKQEYLAYIIREAARTSDPSELIFGAPLFKEAKRVYEETRLRKREGVTMTESEYKCINPQCQSTRISYTRVQGNSGDEGTKTIFRCVICGKTWQTR